MTQILIYISTCIFFLTAGYFIGHIQTLQNSPKQRLGETNNTSNALTIVNCEDKVDLNFCFGNEREKFSETQNTTVWSLTSKDDELRFGVVEKNTLSAYEVYIK